MKEKKAMVKIRSMSTPSVVAAVVLVLGFVGASCPVAAQNDSSDSSQPAGSIETQVQPVTHNTWTTGAPMPVAVNWPATGVIKGKVYVVSGYPGSAPAVTNNQVYNPVTNNWSSAAAIPAPTAQAAGAVVKNVLYLFGGSNNGGTPVFDTVWAYNPKTNAWSSKASMPTARCSAAAVVVDNIIYVIGGFNGGRLNTVEAYNPATDKWTEEADLLLGKSEVSAGVLGSAKTGFTVVAADGFSGSDTGDNEAYDVANNNWKSLAPDPAQRNGACSGVVGGLFYISDGNTSGNSPVAVMESFSLKKDVWKTLAAMPDTVTDPGSAVYKGKLYCIGGGNNAVPPNDTVYNYVQIYQP
jgi:N-acetylneuraminic acid mutarotase